MQYMFSVHFVVVTILVVSLCDSVDTFLALVVKSRSFLT